MLYHERYLELKVGKQNPKKPLNLIHMIGTQIPYVKHFVLSKSTQYRKLKTEWRQNVFLAKSRIQVSQKFLMNIYNHLV